MLCFGLEVRREEVDAGDLEGHDREQRRHGEGQHHREHLHRVAMGLEPFEEAVETLHVTL
ncbi:hypothetical protein D3C86_2020120 [compost metagenome]